MTTQATIWAGREHCEDAVLRGLKFLSPVGGEELRRVWLVLDPAQLARLERKAEGLNVQWRHKHLPTVPQYCADATAKKDACLCGFDALLDVLYEMPPADALLVEDDIEVAPDTLMRLRAVMDATGAAAASGLVRTNRGRWPTFRYEDGFPGDTLMPTDAGHMRRLTDAHLLPVPQPVDAVGTFCLLLSGYALTEMARSNYRPAVDVPTYRLVGKDMHLCCWLRERGHRILLASSVRANHHVEVSPGQVVVYRELR